MYETKSYSIFYVSCKLLKIAKIKKKLDNLNWNNNYNYMLITSI